jgi:CheY-like chemotaxis protein
MQPEPPNPTILLVEHNQGTIDVFARLLRLEGYTVCRAVTGESALRDLEVGRPQAIISDFRLPDIDGLEFLRRLRANAHHSLTPVAIMTGDYFLDETVQSQLRQLGATIRFKPLWLDDLLDLARELVGRTRPRPI